MQRAGRVEEDVFADVIEKTCSLTTSQQKFIQEMLSRHAKVSATSKKSLLKPESLILIKTKRGRQKRGRQKRGEDKRGVKSLSLTNRLALV